jgi:ribonucleotide monophosphatase NagD (HAD superfamily)
MTPPKNYLVDMDGVLIGGRALIPGADGFLGASRPAGRSTWC